MFDSHAHISDAKFDIDRDAVIQRARDAGVEYIMAVADTKESCEAVYSLSEKYGCIYPSAGIHPHYAHNASDNDIRWLKNFIAAHPFVKAIGETGLDFYYGKDSKNQQCELFEHHLSFASEFDLPVIIHCRDAEDVMYSILSKYASVRGVLHCFSGTKKFCTQVLSLGYHVSFSGIVTFKNAQQVREALCCVPMDRLMAETDSPYLAPDGYRGKRNEPAFIRKTIEYLAECKQCPLDLMIQAITDNARTLFKIEGS